MERTILHCDCNNFFASVECLFHRELQGKPVAVTGDPELRHGIVLAKNYEAKKYGIQTGNPLWLAKQLCPDIVFVKPHFDLYMRFSGLAREIYNEYTDRIEPYGLDECWLDVTGCAGLFGSGKAMADTIRRRIKSELGITISVGVSFNKIFAKLGSDYKKPDATTVIPHDTFRDFVWPLPVSSLLYVGHATNRVFEKKGIRTIGDLANTDRGLIKSWLGKCGEILWLFANGYDTSPVAKTGAHPVIKSVGNSTTLPRDLTDEEEIKITLMVLSDSVAARLRAQNLQCSTVQIGIRGTDLSWIERQGRLEIPCCDSTSIYLKAFELLKQNHPPEKPVRSLGVRGCNLYPREYGQTSLLPQIQKTQRRETLEDVLDGLRQRFGNFSVRRGVMLTDASLSGLDPQTDHPNTLIGVVGSR